MNIPYSVGSCSVRHCRRSETCLCSYEDIFTQAKLRTLQNRYSTVVTYYRLCYRGVVSYLTNLKMRSSQGLLLEPPRDILAPSLPSIRWTVSIIIRKHLIKTLARHIKEVNDYVGFHLTVYNIRVYCYLYPSKCYRRNKKNEKRWKVMKIKNNAVQNKS